MRPLSRQTLRVATAILLGGAILSAGDIVYGSDQDRVRVFTRDLEFEYAGWMLGAAAVKGSAAAAGMPEYVDRSSSRLLVSDYLQVTAKIIRVEEALNRVYADPSLADKKEAASRLRSFAADLYARDRQIAPLAEAVLQGQVTRVVADAGLGFLGQPLPAVLYHSTSVPDALIVSPRTEIRQSANVSLKLGMPIEAQAALEETVQKELGASALVVPVGGVGVYPTMVMRTTDRTWLVNTIAHEWTHNYLQLRPLGALYDLTPELRTMNETTADIVGGEIGSEVMRRFYRTAWQPDAPTWAGLDLDYPDPGDADPPPYNFRAEMHRTRLTADLMLASGRIEEAESYMEQRRRLFVENGFYIRRLNQAYFAFYGAYADEPGGPAGQDPVGPAVRALREQSGSLAEFVYRISWMTSFEQLRSAIDG